MFQRLENGLRYSGKPADKRIADAVTALRKLRGEDIPLEEVRAEIRRFSDEARARLEAEGYFVHTLTGQSIKTLKDAGRPFWSTWHNNHPDFETLASRSSEVAIRPDQLFLPKSNGKTLNDQLSRVARVSADLSRQVRGTQVIIGEAPDYVELAYNHLDLTGQRLFGEEFGYGYARTVTPVGGNVANVGDFDAVNGLRVDGWRPDDGGDGLWAAPLVVPA